MEKLTLSAALQSRQAWELFNKHLTLKQWSRDFQLVFKLISDYYNRDDAAKSVDLGLMEELIRASIPVEKHADKFSNLVKEAAATEVSVANVEEVVLAAKRNELAEALAMAIGNGQQHDKELQAYNEVLAKETLLEEDDLEIYTVEDMERLLTDDASREGVIPIYPKALMERLDGGLQGGDSMVIIARPELGKTALILTIVCAIARFGKKVIVFNNEERITRLYLRAISCLTGMTAAEVRKDIVVAMDAAKQRGFNNLIFVSMTPGSPRLIDSILEKHPDCVAFVVDQLRNMLVKADNKTNMLEEAQKAIRNIGKKRNLISISVTQAGDSAEDKSVLGLGDVDSSNTGIPGACDLLIGVGANEQQKREGIRILTPIKNKITGDHEPFPTRINQFISKYVSL